MSTEGPAKPEAPKPPRPEGSERPIESAGIYQEERRKAERNFVLERLRSARVSTKGLDSLRTLMETTTSLEDLQRKLETSEQSFDAESFAEITRIVSEIRSLSETDLRRLKEDILSAERTIRVNPSVFVSIDESSYPSHSWAWVKRLEESPLGENLLRDMAWLAVGMADSGYAVLKLLIDLLTDLVRLPADVVALVREKRQ